MTNEEILTESILLRERWNFVQNVTDRKFWNTQIFVHNKLYSVQGSKFQAFQHTNTNSSTNSQPEDQPPMEQDASANWLDNHTSSTPPLKIISLNCRSVRSLFKWNQLSALITEHNAYVIIGCESHLDSSISSSEILPPNYKIYRKDRSLGGGGVFIGIRDRINATVEPWLDSSSETVWVKILLTANRPLYVCSFYRPPNNDPSPIN